MDKAIIIPARLNSSRLKKKMLIDILGKSLIQRTYESCNFCNNIGVYIATDSSIIHKHCSEFTDKIILTQEHFSGSDRVFEAAQKIHVNKIVNVQGDEPTVYPALIHEIFDKLDKGEEVVSTYYICDDNAGFKNPNNVKVVVDSNDYALYFSRSQIPFLASKKTLWKKHIGIYGYSMNSLSKFVNNSQSKLEKVESLEQLRFFDCHLKIKMLESKKNLIGIDTNEDIGKLLNYYTKS